MDKDVLGGICTVIGTVVGAGVLGVPYAISKSGFLPGLLILLGITVAMIITNLYVGEMCLRTKGRNQLPGLAGKYFGNKGKYIMLILFAFGVYGAMTAYAIGIGDDLAFLLPGSRFIYSILFYLPASLIILKGTKKVEESEEILIPFLMVCAVILAFILMPRVQLKNLQYSKPHHFFFSYGVVLFSLLGFSIVPEVREELTGKENRMKEVLIIGILACALLYTIFTFAFLGAFGNSVKEIATESLKSGVLKYFGFIFSSLSMASSFLALGLALKDMFIEDMDIDHKKAPFLTLVPPLALAFFRFGFIEILEVTGGLLGALMGIVACLAVLKSKKKGERKPEWEIKQKWPLYLLIAMFTLGVIYELFFIF